MKCNDMTDCSLGLEIQHCGFLWVKESETKTQINFVFDVFNIWLYPFLTQLYSSFLLEHVPNEFWKGAF